MTKSNFGRIMDTGFASNGLKIFPVDPAPGNQFLKLVVT